MLVVSASNNVQRFLLSIRKLFGCKNKRRIAASPTIRSQSQGERRIPLPDSVIAMDDPVLDESTNGSVFEDRCKVDLVSFRPPFIHPRR